ncbi:hypothetical protein DB88DRAFT_369008 [Papiliotrema laurentii]|uniref:Secreted protein n=1 Tax=Papiliotrema laurentii TaxID=5418 RepID=A0AAD9FNV7_PAPLA|nr:hypothetical protein DB88DRAFT_369008 [Papiliotrema laurentii]
MNWTLLVAPGLGLSSCVLGFDALVSSRPGNRCIAWAFVSGQHRPERVWFGGMTNLAESLRQRRPFSVESAFRFVDATSSVARPTYLLFRHCSQCAS